MPVLLVHHTGRFGHKLGTQQQRFIRVEVPEDHTTLQEI